jgi:hypothetical protein
MFIFESLVAGIAALLYVLLAGFLLSFGPHASHWIHRWLSEHSEPATLGVECASASPETAERPGRAVQRTSEVVTMIPASSLPAVLHGTHEDTVHIVDEPQDQRRISAELIQAN